MTAYKLKFIKIICVILLRIFDMSNACTVHTTFINILDMSSVGTFTKVKNLPYTQAILQSLTICLHFSYKLVLEMNFCGVTLYFLSYDDLPYYSYFALLIKKAL